MRRFFYSVLAAVAVGLLVVACSPEQGGEDPDPPIKPVAPPRVTLTTEDSGKSVFEMMEFSVQCDDLNYSEMAFLGGFYLSEHYDSIVWSVPDRGMRFKMLEGGEDYHYFYFKFTNHFFSPGRIDTRLSGYRGGEEIYSYDYSVTVANGKDFLRFDWADVVDGQGVNIGYHDVFVPEEQDWSFATYSKVHEGVPSVTLFVNSPGYDFDDEREERLLFELMSDLYGEPEEGDAEVRYDELFHHRDEGAQPVWVWMTAESQIALLRVESDNYGYAVYAEPVEN
ncbi:MAG: hypothetical protein LBV38_04700 [Alistipes sp.]|jgi:hypothetical protein|nr:hypothetical protein [Alistipes sp.]